MGKGGKAVTAAAVSGHGQATVINSVERVSNSCVVCFYFTLHVVESFSNCL